MKIWNLGFLSVKKCLSYGRNCTEQQKLDVVMIKVGGHALQTLEHDKEIENVNILFQSLKKLYGKDQRSIISNVKQLPSESVKIYSVRLKINLRALGIVENSTNTSAIALDNYVSGLLSHISKRVQSLLPETYSIAERYAFQIECEHSNYISKKVDSVNYTEDKIKKEQSQGDKNKNNEELLEKINFLSKPLEKISSMLNNNSPFKSGNKYRSHPHKNTLQNSSVNSYKDKKALNNTS